MRLRFSIVAAACLLAAGCGHNGLTSLGTHLTSSPLGGSDIKIGASFSVADTASNAIDTFDKSANGNAAPTSVISGPATLLASPNGVAIAHDGTIYAANTGVVDSITVYAPGSSGDAIPSRVITCGGMAKPGGISLDGAGNLYVANTAGKSISVFGPADSGCVTGNRIIIGIHTCLVNPQDVDVRRDGTAYVASSSTVLVFRAGASGDATPVQKIAGSNTQLLPHVLGVSFDSSFNIYATSVSAQQKGRVTVYAPGATGNVVPLWTIAGPATTLDAIDKIEIDPADRPFVSNGAAVDVFAAGAMGNVAPVRIITGPATTLVSPAGLDVGP
jgi:hypothetical protein